MKGSPCLTPPKIVITASEPYSISMFYVNKKDKKNITDTVESVLYRKEIISPNFSFFGEFPFFNRLYSSRLQVVLAITFFGASHHISLSDNSYD